MKLRCMRCGDWHEPPLDFLILNHEVCARCRQLVLHHPMHPERVMIARYRRNAANHPTHIAMYGAPT